MAMAPVAGGEAEESHLWRHEEEGIRDLPEPCWGVVQTELRYRSGT